MQKFCPNCGKPVKPGLAFCPNCGAKLNKSQSKPSQPIHSQPTKPIQKSQPKVTSPVQPTKPRVQPKTTQPRQMHRSQVRPSRPRKPMSKKNKIIFSIVGVLVVAFIGFYAWGKNYYSQTNQVDRMIAALKDPNKDLSKYVSTDNSSVEINEDNLKPLQEYYQAHQSEANTLKSNFEYSTNGGKLNLVDKGHYWLLFPKYTLNVPTYTPQIKTNHADSTVSMNGKNIGTLKGSDDNYYKNTKSIFPGKYTFVVKSKVSGRNLSATSNVNVWSNSNIDMNIDTQTFTIKSVPNAIAYINDKKVGTLDSDGKLTFKDYPITKNMDLYVTTTYGKKTIQSATVQDLGSSIENDASDDYSDDHTVDDNGEIKLEDGEYVVEPTWPGVVDKDTAKDLIQGEFESPDDSDFVDGSDNGDYQDLKKLRKDIDNNDDIYNSDYDVEIESIAPAGDNLSDVTFKVTFTFEYDDYDKVQVMEYHGGVIEKTGDDDYKIKSIGKGKMISNKKVDSDDDDD